MSSGEGLLENLDIPLEKRILRTKFCLSPYFSRYAGGKPLRPCHPYVAILSRKRISPCSRVACICLETNGIVDDRTTRTRACLIASFRNSFISPDTIRIKTWSEKREASPLIRAAHFHNCPSRD